MKPVDRRIFLAGGVAAAAGFIAQDDPKRDKALHNGLSALGYTDSSDNPQTISLATTRTKFACNIEMWGFGTNDYAERIKRAADLGFKAVEFWPWRGKDLDAIAKACKDTGLQVTQFTGWGFVPGLNDPKNHDAFVKEIEASCAAANKIGAPLVLVVAGNDQPGMTRAQMHQNVIDGLKRAAPIAEKAGVTLMLEPMNIRIDHKGHCLYGSPDAIRICKAVASKNVKICWDLYHMEISEGDLCGHIKEGFDEIAYFQIADNPGRNEPGTGEVHYNRVFRQAYELGYRGWFGVECNPSQGEVKAALMVAAADMW